MVALQTYWMLLAADVMRRDAGGQNQLSLPTICCCHITRAQLAGVKSTRNTEAPVTRWVHTSAPPSGLSKRQVRPPSCGNQATTIECRSRVKEGGPCLRAQHGDTQHAAASQCASPMNSRDKQPHCGYCSHKVGSGLENVFRDSAST